MLVEMSGSRENRPWPARGEIADLPTAVAAHYVASGIAEEVTDDAPDEAEGAEVKPARPPAARKKARGDT